jgi:hypothetical protein
MQLLDTILSHQPSKYNTTYQMMPSKQYKYEKLRAKFDANNEINASIDIDSRFF